MRVSVVLFVAALLELLHAAAESRRRRRSATHRRRRSGSPREPGTGAVAILPLGLDIDSTPAMVQSLEHRRPIVNGYSGQRPAFYGPLVDAINTFPSADALAALHDSGVRFVVTPAPDRTASRRAPCHPGRARPISPTGPSMNCGGRRSSKRGWPRRPTIEPPAARRDSVSRRRARAVPRRLGWSRREPVRRRYLDRRRAARVSPRRERRRPRPGWRSSSRRRMCSRRRRTPSLIPRDTRARSAGRLAPRDPRVRLRRSPRTSCAPAERSPRRSAEGAVVLPMAPVRATRLPRSSTCGRCR